MQSGVGSWRPAQFANVKSWSEVPVGADKALYSVDLAKNQAVGVRKKSGSGKAVLTFRIFSKP